MHWHSRFPFLFSMIEQKAYAKINLSLEVVGRRDDGYHDIVSVMQMVELHDTLIFGPSDDLTLECDDPALADAGEANLVLRAARTLQDAHRLSQGARIILRKRIPVAAGLGGGSSDAASTLRGLSALWGLDLSRSEIRELAISLGSDVPFFLDGPTALVEGRGESVTTVPAPASAWVVLVSEPYEVPNKTARLYESLHKQDMTRGIASRRLISRLVDGDFPSADLLCNSFERAAYSVFEGLDRIRRTVLHAGGRDVHLSGSGPSLYVLFPLAHEARARALHETLAQSGLRTFLTRTLTKGDL